MDGIPKVLTNRIDDKIFNFFFGGGGRGGQKLKGTVLVIS